MGVLSTLHRRFTSLGFPWRRAAECHCLANSEQRSNPFCGPVQGFPIRTKLLILNREMIRIATAFIALLSVLSAPVASAICTECCQRPVQHQLALCHHKADAFPGPHVHHMNQVHRVAQESDTSAVIQPCEHRFEDAGLRCHSTACLSAKPVPRSAASVPAHLRTVSSHSIVTTISSFLTISGPLGPPGACRMAISSSQSAPVSLRI
jgi:hypothetical protein